MHQFLNFKDKVVLVTGSTKGIGKATAKLFAECGAIVIINSRHKDDVERTVNEFRALGLHAEGFAADVGNWSEVQAMMRMIDSTFHRLDVVVNNAAVRRGGHIDSIGPEEWDEMFRINVAGAFYISKAGVEIMKRQKSGSIINIASGAAVTVPEYAGLHYISSKGALFSFTRGLAKTLGGFGIRANAVMPAMLQSGMHQRIKDTDYFKHVLGSSPLKRLGTPEEVAQVCLFLASDMASFVTGEIISVGGNIKPNIEL